MSYLTAVTNLMKSTFGKHKRFWEKVGKSRVRDRLLRPRFVLLHPQISKLIRHNISFRLWLLDYQIMRDMTIVFAGLGSEPRVLLLRDELLGVMRQLEVKNSPRKTDESAKERQKLFAIAKELRLHEHTRVNMKGRSGGGKGIQKWRAVGQFQPSPALMAVERTLPVVEALSLELAIRCALVDGVYIYAKLLQKLRNLDRSPKANRLPLERLGHD